MAEGNSQQDGSPSFGSFTKKQAGELFRRHLLSLYTMFGRTMSENWSLTPVHEVDGIVFSWKSSTGKYYADLVQVKYEKSKTITEKDLFSSHSRQGDIDLVKSFLFYQDALQMCNIRNVTICTNADIQIREEYIKAQTRMSSCHPLYVEGTRNLRYTFNEAILPRLKKNVEKYLNKNKQLNVFFVEQDIKHFLDRLEVIAKYPSGSQLENIISDKVLKCEQRTYVNQKNGATQDAADITMGTISQRQNGYADLNPGQGEKWRKNYSNVLKHYDIFFKNSFSFTDIPNNIVHIVTRIDNLLHALKVYRELEEKHALFVNLEDNPVVLLELLRDSCYTHLVILSPEKSTQNVRDVFKNINRSLKMFPGMKVVLIAKEDYELARQFKTTQSCRYKAINKDIRFVDLTEDTQCKLLEKYITFQGEVVTLRKLLPADSADKDLDKIITPEVLLRLVQNETLEVGKEIKPLLEDDYFSREDDYISRNFHRNEETISEQEMCMVEENFEKKVVLISGIAGMGKTTLLKNMAVAIKKTHAHLWVVPVNLNSYPKCLEKYSGSQISLVQLLDSRRDTGFKDDFERKMFSIKQKVLLIDEVYEVRHTHEWAVFNLIKRCCDMPGVKKIFITTRPYLREKLEKLVDGKSWTLDPIPLPVENQLSRFSENERVLKVPLYLKLATEVYKEREFDLRDEIDLIREFIKNLKLDSFQEIQLERVAVKHILSEDDLAKFKGYEKNKPETLKEHLLRQHIIHRTIAEYLTAQLIIKELLENQSTKFTNFLTTEILYRNEYNGVVAFLDRLLRTYYFSLKPYKQRQRGKQAQSEFGGRLLWTFDKMNYQAIMKLLIEFGADINLIDEELDRTLLQETAKDGRLEAVKFLVAEGADTDAKDKKGNTALHHAGYEGHVGVVKFLVQKGADVNAQDECDVTVFHQYVHSNDTEMVRYLLDNSGVDVNKKIIMDLTALHAAVYLGNLEMTRMLVEKGADINSQAETFPLVSGYLTRANPYRSQWEAAWKLRISKFTPLHLAVRARNLSITEFLLEKGGDINIPLQDEESLKTVVGIPVEAEAIFRYLIDKWY